MIPGYIEGIRPSCIIIPAASGWLLNSTILRTSDSEPWDIAAGPDNNLWFTEYSGNKVGRISSDGTITEYPVPTADSWPSGIAAGADGREWFAEYLRNKIGAVRLRR